MTKTKNHLKEKGKLFLHNLNEYKMKKILIISVSVLAVGIWSCSDVKRKQNRVYMPDMAYSRAYETYAPIDTLEKQGIHYNRIPVPGTIKRGELFPFPVARDKGDSVNYKQAKAVNNPLASLDGVQMKEAERLYLVNCGICHGTKLDGNGPLHTRSDGTPGPYIAAPANLVTRILAPGEIFYTVTYGKGQMGSYASQLSTTQRWMVVSYVKSKQAGGAGAPAAGADTTSAAKKPADTTAAKK
jgi:mono/diheme cytochrome c family protein